MTTIGFIATIVGLTVATSLAAIAMAMHVRGDHQDAAITMLAAVFIAVLAS